MYKISESALLLYAINNWKCSNSNLFTTLVLLLVLYDNRFENLYIFLYSFL